MESKKRVKWFQQRRVVLLSVRTFLGIVSGVLRPRFFLVPRAGAEYQFIKLLGMFEDQLPRERCCVALKT